MYKNKNQVISELRADKEELYKELWEKSSRAIAKDKHINKLTEIISKQNEEIEDLQEIQKALSRTSLSYKNKYYDAVEEIDSLRETIRELNGIVMEHKLTIANTAWGEIINSLKYKKCNEQISDLLGDLYDSKQTEEHLRAILDMEASIREMNQKIINKLIK